MGQKSLDKGRRGETEIIKILSSWWGPGHWGRRGLGHKGCDLVCPDGFPFSVEVKNYKDVKLRELWAWSKRFQDWWAQACKAERPALLCVKIERQWYAVFAENEDISSTGSVLNISPSTRAILLADIQSAD